MHVRVPVRYALNVLVISITKDTRHKLRYTEESTIGYTRLRGS